MALKLPQVLDTVAAAPLLESFRGARGQALHVDASAVDRIGALCLQVILTAQMQWAADGQPFSIVAASAPFTEGLNLAGANTLLEAMA